MPVIWIYCFCKHLSVALPVIFQSVKQFGLIQKGFSNISEILTAYSFQVSGCLEGGHCFNDENLEEK